MPFMNPKLLFLFLFASFSFITKGQEIGLKLPNPKLFSSGITLNDSINIPWGANFKDIAQYGNPKLTTHRNKVIFAEWESTSIIDNIKVKLLTNDRNVQIKGSEKLISSFFAYINPSDFETVKNALFQNLGEAKKVNNFSKKYFLYRWFIDEVRITLGHSRPNGYYLALDRRKENAM
jgi:hypothetical protein